MNPKPKKQQGMLSRIQAVSWVNLAMFGVLMVALMVIIALTGSVTERGNEIERYEAQCEKLGSASSLLQAELDTAEVALVEAQKSESLAWAEASSVASQYQKLATEVTGLKTNFQIVSAEKAVAEQRWQQSQYESVELRRLLNEQLVKYKELRAVLVKVNDRKDSTVNDFTEAERIAFYVVWDEWWEEVD